jgi:hypothetical protein
MKEIVRTSVGDTPDQSPLEADTETKFSKQEQRIIDIAVERDPKAFDESLATANTGDKIIYHRGEFAGGRHKTNAMVAQDAGLVALVQRRIGPKQFEYIAQRTKKRWKKGDK